MRRASCTGRHYGIMWLWTRRGRIYRQSLLLPQRAGAQRVRALTLQTNQYDDSSMRKFSLRYLSKKWLQFYLREYTVQYYKAVSNPIVYTRRYDLRGTVSLSVL